MCEYVGGCGRRTAGSVDCVQVGLVRHEGGVIRIYGICIGTMFAYVYLSAKKL